MLMTKEQTMAVFSGVFSVIMTHPAVSTTLKRVVERVVGTRSVQRGSEQFSDLIFLVEARDACFEFGMTQLGHAFETLITAAHGGSDRDILISWARCCLVAEGVSVPRY